MFNATKALLEWAKIQLCYLQKEYNDEGYSPISTYAYYEKESSYYAKNHPMIVFISTIKQKYLNVEHIIW